MALQVWLPLNGTLENKGLSNVTVTNNGATVDNNGKIGKCYHFNSNTLVFSTSFTGKSICFWIKASKTNSTIAFVDYNSQLAFGFYNGAILASSNLSTLQFNSSAFTANAWNHVTIIRQTSDVDLYINGEKLTNRVGSTNQWSNSTAGCCIGGRSTGNYMNCYINDFRIYNHTLSPKEVKEISKGLILHYKLDGNDIGMTIPRNGGLIPDGVELYDYILSSGTLRIDTGIVPDMTLDTYFKVETLSGALDASPIIGARVGSSNPSRYFPIAYSAADSTLRATLGNTEHVFSYTNGIYEGNFLPTQLTSTINGTTRSLSNNGFIKTENNTLQIFGTTGYGTDYWYTKAKVYYVKLVRNDQVLRNMLPCTYLGEPGMWDTVENKFYRNQGTGLFTLGNKVTLKEYEYLQDSSAAYINTNFIPTPSTEFDLGISFNTLPNAEDIFFAASETLAYVNGKNFALELGSGNKAQIRLFKTENSYGNPVSVIVANTKYSIKLKNSILYLNDNVLATPVVGTFPNYSLYLFSRNIAGSNDTQYTHKCIKKVYYLKIYNNNQLVRDFIPVSYNGTPGLWDKVEWKFYANAGSGSFTLGPEKTVQQDAPIFYDSSGYCNHGSITGTLTTNSDSPRYTNCTYFNGSSYITTPVGQLSWSNFEQLTISAWIKPTVTPSLYTGSIGIGHRSANAHKYFAISNYAGKFYAHIINGNYTNFNSGYTLPLNTWHHCVATLSGTTLKMYVDGELKSTQTISWNSAAIHSSPSFLIGIDLPGTAEIYKGYYSDARIYTTALSEDDVKELYNTSAFLTNNGVFAEYELYEDNLSDVKKTGLLETANFYENGAESGYALDTDKTRVASNYIISEEFIEI